MAKSKVGSREWEGGCNRLSVDRFGRANPPSTNAKNDPRRIFRASSSRQSNKIAIESVMAI